MAGSRPGGGAGFTLIELLVVLAVVGLLAAMLAPGLARARGQAQSVVCASHVRQLTLAWISYAEENADRLLPNLAGAVGFHETWLPGNPMTTLTEWHVRRGLLYPYAGDPRVYRCPTVRGEVRIHGRQHPRGTDYSLSIYLGGGLPGRSLQDWLGRPAAMRMAAITRPSESLTFVGEDPGGHGGTQFVGYPPGRFEWISFPADHHGGGCQPAFADGHTERWRWRWPKAGRWQSGMPVAAANEADLADLRRLQRALAL